MQDLGPCPTCGRIGVWMCSKPLCGQRTEQKALRDEWIEKTEGYRGPAKDDAEHEPTKSY